MEGLLVKLGCHKLRSCVPRTALFFTVEAEAGSKVEQAWTSWGEKAAVCTSQVASAEMLASSSRVPSLVASLHTKRPTELLYKTSLALVRGLLRSNAQDDRQCLAMLPECCPDVGPGRSESDGWDVSKLRIRSNIRMACACDHPATAVCSLQAQLASGIGNRCWWLHIVCEELLEHPQLL